MKRMKAAVAVALLMGMAGHAFAGEKADALVKRMASILDKRGARPCVPKDATESVHIVVMDGYDVTCSLRSWGKYDGEWLPHIDIRDGWSLRLQQICEDGGPFKCVLFTRKSLRWGPDPLAGDLDHTGYELRYQPEGNGAHDPADLIVTSCELERAAKKVESYRGGK